MAGINLDKTITITRKEFVEATAKVMNGKDMMESVKGNPVLVLAFAVYTSLLDIELFGKEEE